jgi:hypothetical protein
MKKCPYCAEEIQDEAIVCRYCGRDLQKVAPSSQSAKQQTTGKVNKRSNNILWAVIIFICLIIFMRGLGTKGASETPTQTAEVSSSVVIRTFTPALTNTPAATETPIPTAIPSSTPEPIFLVQSGDAVFNIQKWQGPAILKIKHTGARNFVVRNYPDQGNVYYDLLVNTIGAYEGTVPLDFRDGEQTARFEVKADGAWEFNIEPITNARKEQIPGKISGNGDDVIIIEGGIPDLVKVDASQARRNFVVKAVAKGKFDLVVNEIAPYTGTSLLDPSTIVLIINATGPWELEITGQ